MLELAFEFFSGIPEEVVYDQDSVLLISENYALTLKLRTSAYFDIMKNPGISIRSFILKYCIHPIITIGAIGFLLNGGCKPEAIIDDIDPTYTIFEIEGKVRSGSEIKWLSNIQVVMQTDTSFTDDYGFFSVQVEALTQNLEFLLEFKDLENRPFNGYLPMDSLIQFKEPFVNIFIDSSGLGFVTKKVDVQLKKDVLPNTYGFIIAGDQQDCFYFEVGDTIISRSGFGITSNREFSRIDINFDGTHDLSFSTLGSGGQGSYMQETAIESAINCQISLDTIQTEHFGEKLIPHIYNSNDTIGNHLIFTTEEVRFIFSHFRHRPYIPWVIDIWKDAEDAYVGFVMHDSSSPLYGWVRIDVIGYRSIIVKDFAVRR